jgi:hypothetical protein
MVNEVLSGSTDRVRGGFARRVAGLWRRDGGAGEGEVRRDERAMVTAVLLMRAGQPPQRRSSGLAAA